MTSHPLVCFAVKEEPVFFRKPENFDMIITGMGGENAFNSVEKYLQNHQPPYVLTCGFAGALSPGLELHEILFSCDSAFPLAGAFLDLGGLPAAFLHSTRVAVTSVEKKALRVRTGADAVEMESSVIRELCRALGIPCATLRVVSDTANEDLPLDFNQFMDAKSQLRLGSLVFHALTHPASIPKLIRFGKQTRASAKTLGTFLNALFAGPTPRI